LFLWRDGRDGFGARDFHSRCDGHANTLTVILNTHRDIFGRFTPVEWESSDDCEWKTNKTLKSFLFTLKNPHNVPAPRFALKAETKEEALDCDSELSPSVCEIGVFDDCNTNTDSFTYNFGIHYTNDTGRDKETFFTGSWNFKVQEIEVFDIIN
jgi:hypothetical protein